MATLQRSLITAAILVAIGVAILAGHQASRRRQEILSLRQEQARLTEQIEQLRQERDEALKRGAAYARRTPRLPAPPMPVEMAAKTPGMDSQLTNLVNRFKEGPPRLTPEQVAAYLKANRTNAASLLAAYRSSEDPALLKEAMAKFPNNPQVAFEAALARDLPPEQQRQWLDAFEQSAPNNALANYLSALNYFHSGQTEQAIQELTAASGKGFDDYTWERAQEDEEVYLSAGYSAAEAQRIADSWLELSQLAPLKQLGVETVNLAKGYNQSGDQASAQIVLEMAMNLGQRYEDPSAGGMLISQLVGSAIQKTALGAMDPNSPYGNSGQTVQDQLNQITTDRAAITELVQQATPLLPTLPDADVLNYENRRRAFGEVAALQWVVSKYGQK